MTAPTKTKRGNPDHGTRACYLSGCRREACVDANRRYCKHYRSNRLRNGDLRVDPAPAAARCRALAAEGWSERQIAAAAGCSERAVHDLLVGAHRHINRPTAEKLLRSPAPTGTPPFSYIDATGTSRRGRALVAIGYQIKDIAAAIGMAVDPLARILNHPPAAVRACNAHAMAALYVQWSRRPGPSARSRGLAASRGWLSPAAWDSDIDNPAAEPYAAIPEADTRRTFEIARERHAEMLHLARYGVSTHEIARRVDRSETTVRELIRKTSPALLSALIA